MKNDTSRYRYLTKPLQATQCGDALRALGLLLAVLQLPPAR